MHRHLTSVLLSMVALTSCTQVLLVGSLPAAISHEDVRQIQRLVAQRGDLRSDAMFIRPVSADRAVIQSGSADEYTDYHTFTVRKTAGAWKVEDATIRTQRERILH